MGEKGGGLLIEQRRKLPHQECPSLGVKPVKGCKRGYHPPIRKTGIPYTGRYQVEFEGDLIVSDSRDPETDLARALLSRGITGMVKVMDANNKKHRCTVDIEKAAKLRTVEGPHGPRFVAYQTCLNRAPRNGSSLYPTTRSRRIAMDGDSPFAPLKALKVPETLMQRFNQWLHTAKGGETFLNATRHALDPQTPPEIEAVAWAAREAYARGEIELVQKRSNGPGSPFEYMAIKLKGKRPPLVHGVPWVPKIIKPGYCR